MATKNKNKGSLTTKSSGALNWFKNVGKSLGYTSTELVNEMMPASMEFVTSNEDTVSELFTEIRNFRSIGKRVTDSINANSQIGIGRDVLKNALEDIKSGKIYNKERQEAIYNEGLDDFDFGDGDFEMGNDDFSLSDSMDDISSPVVNKNTTVNVVEPSMNKNNPMVKALERQTQATIQAAQSINDVNIGLSSNALLVNRQTSSAIVQGMESLNANLSLLVNFQSESMGKYIGASLKFYEENLKVLNDTLTHLQTVSSKGVDQEQEKKIKEDPLDNALLSRGGLNVKGYMNMMKKNLGNAIDSNMFLSPIKSMLEDTDTLKFLAASPLSFISTKIVASLIPGFLKKSMENMDQSFQNFFPALLMKINRLAFNSNNPFLQIIGQIFGANVKTKTSIDLSQYKKGTVPFDGVTKKAITDVIPTYLRKILATLSGKEEQAFDYEKGSFRSVFEMSKEFKKEQERTILSNFSDVIDEIKTRSEAFLIEDNKDRDAFREDIDKFFVKLAKTPYGVNPFNEKDAEGNTIDELKNVHQFKSNDMQRLFKQIVMSLPNNTLLDMAGTSHINARKGLERFMTEAEENQYKYGVSAFQASGFDEHIKRDSTTGKYEVRRGFGMNAVDKFGHNTLDYLRDIKKILLDGIIVFPNGDSSTSPGNGSGTPPTPSGGTPSPLDRIRERTAKMKKEETDYATNNSKYNKAVQRLSEEQKRKKEEDGKWVFGSSIDLSDKSDKELREHAEAYAKMKSEQENPDQQETVAKWFAKFLKGGAQDKYNMIREKVDDILQTPAKLMKGVFDKIDSAMFKIVFGASKDGSPSSSFMDQTLANLKGKFADFGNWIKNDIFLPAKEALFGKDGMFTKIKQSDFYTSLQKKMGKLADFIFGRPTGENGAREGGLMSDTANEMLDIWDGAKYYFTGKGYTNRAGVSFGDNENSVFGEVKKVFGGFKDTLKIYLFGDKNANDPDLQKGVFTGAFNALKNGFTNFSEAMFGPKKNKDGTKNNNYIAFDEMTKKIKERAPKSLAFGIIGSGAGLLMGGKLGLLGSLLLPGGPIGGAIVGSTLGFLTQSDRFKNWLFGDKDSMGERTGGVISKSTQEFFKKNKAGMVGGAVVGAMKPLLGFGMLPSFFLPGGPVGGAVMGIAGSMLYRSEAVQKFLFGEKGADGKRDGGIFNKIFRSTNKNKDLLGNVGAGIIGGSALGLVTSKLGIMGALMLPGGPLGGAVLGAAAGIALSSEKWKKAIFGEFDEKTNKRQGGLIGKFSNWFKLEVQEPLKLKFSEINLNIKEWFTKSIANPFADAIAPLKKEFSIMVTNMKDMFKKGWENFTSFIGNVFEKHVGMPFGKFMEDKVMKPLKGFFSKILNFSGKIMGNLLAAPFKGLNMLSQGLTKKHAQRGLTSMIDQGWNGKETVDENGNVVKEGGILNFKERRAKGEKLGLFSTKDKDGNKVGKGFFGRLNDMYFNKQTRDAARYGENGADYADPNGERMQQIAKRNKEQDETFSKERALLEAKKQRLDIYRSLGLKYDYDNFLKDKDGNYLDVDVSRIYRPDLEGKNKSKIGMPQEEIARKISDMTKVPLEQLLGEGGSVDFKSLDKKQKKMIRKAIESGSLDSTLAKLFGVKPKTEEEKKEEAGATPVIEAQEETNNRMEELITVSQENRDILQNDISNEMRRTSGFLESINNAIDKIASRIIPGHKSSTLTLSSDTPVPTIDNEATEPNPTDRLTYNIGEKFSGLKDALGFGKNKDKEEDEEHSHASGIDNVPHDNYKANLHQGEMVVPAKQANAIREAAGHQSVPASSATGPVNDSNRLVNNISKGLPKGKDALLARIATDVRNIASEVNGQLNGVGSNINKIRKSVQKMANTSDDGAADPANKDRVGFFGRVRKMLYKPLDSIKEFFVAKLRTVGEFIGKIGTGIKDAAKAILSVPVTIAKGIKNFAIELGNIAKTAVISLVKLPGQIVGMVGDAFKAVGETLKVVGPAIGESLMGVAKIFSGAMGAVKETMIGFGKGVGSLFFQLGKGTGELLVKFGKMTMGLVETVGNTIGKTFTIVTDFGLEMTKRTTDMLFAVGSNIADFTLKTITGVGEKLAEVGNTLWQIVTSPLKFLSQGLGKLLGIQEQKVVVVGGTLDVVREVQSIGTNRMAAPRSLETNTDSLVQSVRIVGSDVCLPVYLCPEKIVSSFEKIQPFAVRVDQSNGVLATALSPDSMKEAFNRITPLPVRIDTDMQGIERQSGFSVSSLVGGSSTAMVAPEFKNNNLAASVLAGMDKFDESNDKEEEAKKQNERLESEAAARQAHASRLTAANVQAANALKEEKQHERNWKDRILELLAGLGKDTRQHTTDWADIFGKKGLFMVGALTLLPLLKKAMEWLLGKGNDSRTDVGGTTIVNSDLVEHGTRAVGYGIKKASEHLMAPLKNSIQEFKKTFQGVKKVWDEVFPPIKKKGIEMWDDVSEKAHVVWDDIAEKSKGVWDNIAEKFTGTWDNIAKKFFPNIVEKGVNVADDAARATAKNKGPISKVVDKVKQFGNKGDVEAGEVIMETSNVSFVDEATEGTSKIAQAVNPANDVVKKAGGGKVVDFAAAKAAKESGEDVTKIAVDGADDVVDAVNKGRIEKFTKMAMDAVDNIARMFEKKFPKAAKAIGPAMDVLGKVLKKVKWVKYLPKVAKGLAKIAAAAATALASDAVWATWGAVTGGFEAAHLFKVDSDEVDWIMRAISSGMKALLNVSWFFVIEILNDICVEMTGVDFIQMMATQIYKAITSDEKGAKLEQAQADFKAEVDAYNEANGTKLSVDAYNDKVNKTVGQHIADGVSNTWKGIKAGASWVGDKTSKAWNATTGALSWAGNKIGEGAQWAGNKIAQGASVAWDATKKGAAWAGEKISQGAQWAGEKIQQGASVAWDATKKGAKMVWDNSALGGAVNAFKNDDMVKQNFNLKGDGKITTGMRAASGAAEALEKLSLGLLDAEKTAKTFYGIGLRFNDFMEGTKKFIGDNLVEPAKKAWTSAKEKINEKLEEFKKEASETWNGIKEGIGKQWNSAKETIGGALSAVGQYTSEKWEALKTNIGSAWDSAKTVVGEKLEAFKQNASETWDALKTNIGNAWSSAKETIGGKLEEFKANTSETWGNIKSNIGDAWGTAKGIIGEKLEAFKAEAGETWESIKSGVGKQWESAKSLIGTAAANIKDTAGNIWNSMPEPVKDRLGEAKETITTGAKKLADGAKELWGNIGDTISDKWKDIKKHLTEGLDRIGGFFKGIGNFFKNGFDSVKNFFTGRASDELDKLGWGEGGYGNVPVPDTKYNKSLNKRVPKVEGGGFGVESDTINNFAYYSQGDDRWGRYAYDHSPQFGTRSENPTLKARGCGPTSMAMVATQLTGKRYEPPQMADLAQKGGYSSSAGTSWGYFDKMASMFSLQKTEINPSSQRSQLQSMLDQHVPIILSGTRKHSADQSPFTSSGHFVVAVANDGPNGIVINDPRGPAYSKTYNLNTVLDEARKGWGFRYTGGSLPDPRNPEAYTPSSSPIGGTMENPTILDLFGKMSEAFSLYSENLYSGENKQLSWGDSFLTGSSSSDGYVGNFNIDFIPKNVQDAILKKTAELTVKHESGGKYTYGRNDVNASTGQRISPSIGIIQWRGGNAKAIMDRMLQEMPDNPEARYFASKNWNDSSPWSQSEQDRLEKYLASNMQVTKKVQDSFLLDHVKNRNLAPVYKYGVEPGKIKDPRSIAFLAEIANSGPALVKPFLERYSPTSATGKAEFQHFYNEFMSKSYWGPKSIYSNRLKSSFNSLVDWDPEQGGFGDRIVREPETILGGFGDMMCDITTKLTSSQRTSAPEKVQDVKGGFGDLTESITDTLNNALSGEGKIKSEGMRLPSFYEDPNPEVRSYMYGNSDIQKAGLSDDLLKTAIEVLRNIENNTGATSEGIKELNKKECVVNVITKSQTTTSIEGEDGEKPAGSTIVVAPPQTNNYINPIMGMANDRRNNKQQRDYQTAKGIAKGRTN